MWNKKKRDPYNYKPQRELDDQAILAFRVLECLSVLCLYAVGIIGISLIFKGCWQIVEIKFFSHPDKVVETQLKYVLTSFTTSTEASDIQSTRAESPLYTALTGLEILFFAPLSYLVLRSIGTYICDLKIRDDIWAHRRQKEVEISIARLKIAMEQGVDVGDVPIEELPAPPPELILTSGKESLMEAKALTVSLLFAIVATNLVGEILASHGAAELDMTKTLLTIGFLAILTITFFGIEILSVWAKSQERASHQNSD